MGNDWGTITGNWYAVDSTYITTTDSSSDSIAIPFPAAQKLSRREKKATPKPETNLAWLDRRVDEMRVEL